jgi:hypothetical protein
MYQGVNEHLACQKKRQGNADRCVRQVSKQTGQDAQQLQVFNAELDGLNLAVHSSRITPELGAKLDEPVWLAYSSADKLGYVEKHNYDNAKVFPGSWYSVGEM